MSIIQTVKSSALRVAVAATAFGPMLAFAEDTDPTVALIAKITQAGAWAAGIGVAVLAFYGGVFAIKAVRKGL